MSAVRSCYRPPIEKTLCDLLHSVFLFYLSSPVASLPSGQRTADSCPTAPEISRLLKSHCLFACPSNSSCSPARNDDTAGPTSVIPLYSPSHRPADSGQQIAVLLPRRFLDSSNHTASSYVPPIPHVPPLEMTIRRAPLLSFRFTPLPTGQRTAASR